MQKESPTAATSWKMFDQIASTYDLLNRVLSGGIDKAWRKKMTRYLTNTPNQHLLDLATGTADQLIAMCDHSDRIASAVGMDLSREMLAIGRKKLEKTSRPQEISLQTGDAMALPAEDDTFDVLTISFGIRNVPDVPKALREMCRVLKPSGRALIMEFSLPPNALVRSGYLLYFRHLLPRIGGLLSGNREAYTYLNQSVESFPSGQAFLDLMGEAGFHNLQAHPLTFGIASIYQGDKPPREHDTPDA